MTPIQKIQIRMSETREKLNGMLEVRDGDADKLAERQKLVDKVQALEGELRAAIEADDDTTPETREWADVSDRFDLGEMFENVIEHRASDGPIAEVQKERGLAANALPVEMLMEKRAVTPGPTDTGQTQNAIEGYVFPNSVAVFLGVPSPVVPVGDTTFPVLTSDPAAGTPAEDGAQAETTGAFSADVLTPARIQAQFFWSRESAARMAGMADALRDALQGGIADKLDSEIMRGTNGLLTGTNLANHNASSETSFADYISDFGYSRVDGRFAASGADLRLVMGSATYAHAGGQYRHANADDVALDRLTEITGGVRVSSHVPSVASSKQNAVIRKGLRGDMVAPVWGSGVVLIPDEITKAANGQIVLTAVLLHAVKIIRAGGFYKKQSQHA